MQISGGFLAPHGSLSLSLSSPLIFQVSGSWNSDLDSPSSFDARVRDVYVSTVNRRGAGDVLASCLRGV